MIENKVLIVDDEKDLANIMRDFLENEGMQVETAYNGKQAYEKLKSFQPNLVILDIMLPDDDGKEICRYIRNKSDIPIMMLSAKSSDVDQILSLGLGADEYLTKPFSPLVVVAHVKAMLRRYRNQNKPRDLDIMDYGDLKMNLKKHSLTIRGKSIDLVNKEFDVLWFLASHPGEVFTKEQIYDEVWGVDEFGEISTVTVHIRKIRSKIEEDSTSPGYIKTIWGVGYKFES